MITTIPFKSVPWSLVNYQHRSKFFFQDYNAYFYLTKILYSE